MESISDVVSAKGIIIRCQDLDVSVKDFKTVLRRLPIQTRSIDVDLGEVGIFAEFEFFEPIEIKAFTTLLEEHSIKPNSIEPFEIESDTEEEEERKIEQFPKKRVNETSVHDLETSTKLLQAEQLSKLSWLASEFDKIYIKSRQPNAILSCSSNSNSNENSDSDSSSYESDSSSDESSESSENSEHEDLEEKQELAVLRENLIEMNNLNSAPAELTLKKVCIRSGENSSSLGPMELSQTAQT